MKRTDEEYLALPYTVEITPDEGCDFVRVKELVGCMSVGVSKVDARKLTLFIRSGKC
jgi:hypothetical protein